MPSLPITLFLLAPLAGEVEFNRDVRPILSDACYACHGPDSGKRKGGLRLDTEAGARSVLVAGKPARSELWRRVSAHVKGRMPPAKATRRLTENEKQVLRRWIEQGARWQPHWAFVPPRRPAPPSVKGAAWADNPIDRFLLARMEKAGLKPSPPTPPEAWLRRVTLDLTGLPPTVAEQDAFLADRRPGARRRVVDRLLASPRFGERMAIRWLNAARYADTNGYQNDGDRVMWRWRDWVIDAYNANMPFDQFSVEQLAGDLLEGATLEQRIASGFNRNHRLNAEGGIIPEEYAAEYVADRVETTATVWLGLTLACSRCHDHKYDQLSQKDFYSLFAFFNNVPERGKAVKYGNSPPLLLTPTRRQQEKLRQLDGQIREGFAFLEGRDWVSFFARWEKGARGDRPEPLLPQEVPLPPVKAGSALPGAGKFSYTARFSLAARVRPEKNTGTILSRMEDDPEGPGYWVGLRDGRVQVNLVKRWLDDSIRLETLAALPTNRDTHVLVTYDGSRWARGVKVYLDGKEARLRVTVDELNQPFDVGAPFRVGAGGGPAGRFQGAIRDVRVFERDLSAREAEAVATPGSIGELLKLAPKARSPGQAVRIARYIMENHAPARHRDAFKRGLELQHRRQLYIDTLPTTMVMEEMPRPRPTFVLKRGQYDQPGERVHPATPASLPAIGKGLPRNRLGLARWLVSPENPLTARVAVNRLWEMLFGAGLVRTPDDFGAQGEAPSHPELLDWLAVEYRESGWDTKRLLRLMALSRAYAQSSRLTRELASRDPQNRLLARMPRLRLSAEMVRDQALAAAGLLTRDIGGPSVKPYQPPGLWRELADVPYERDRGPALYRRGLYVFWKRTVAPPGLATFDAPGRETCVVRETRTNTPLQALNLLNDVTYVEAGRVLAQKALRLKGDREKVIWMTRRVLARRPREAELKLLLAGLARHREHYTRDIEAARKLIGAGDAPTARGVDQADLAALTAVAGVLLNLDEAITRE